MKLIDKINFPKDLRKLNLKDKKQLATEIREYILEVTSKNGGHLASNLGVVELTIALHSVFNTPSDKVIWDVGHQSYVHKILTGRKDKMKSLRQHKGISGFPKTKESEFDTFNTGHSSTSISAAAGMARARDLKNKKYQVIAVIGDGALTGGMALEALNDVGSSNLNMTIILNDNEMSISKNVGGIPLLLSTLRTKRIYIWLNNHIRYIFDKIPFIGKYIVKLFSKIKSILKRIFIKNMYFEDIGYTYLGPINGHDIEELEDIFEKSKSINGPVLIHVITKKGKGYKYAEENPSKFHSTSSFDINTGETLKSKKKDYSEVFGNKLCELAKKNKDIVAITAAMTDGTGLKEFSELYPKRFYDVGIAEQHALGLAAGLSSQGIIPVVPIYSSFLQRAYDQIVHDIALQNLHVVMCIDRAGIVGNDGETHHGIFDLSYLSSIPNLVIMAPKNFKELEDMLEFAIKYNGPIAIRYPRGSESNNVINTNNKLILGEPEIYNTGKDLTIITIGKTIEKAIKIREELLKENINTKIINMRFLKPLNTKLLIKELESNIIVTIEDNMLKGGLQDTILELLNNNNLNKKLLSFGYKNYVSQGSIEELEKDNKLDTNSILNEIKKVL